MQELASFVVEANVVETVAGVDEAVITELEQARGYRLPACYRAFLQTFGKTNTWCWFNGDCASIDRFDETLEAECKHCKCRSLSVGFSSKGSNDQ